MGQARIGAERKGRVHGYGVKILLRFDEEAVALPDHSLLDLRIEFAGVSYVGFTACLI
jgi:hypothetical protein